MGLSVASPTKRDLNVAIDLLKRNGMAAVNEAVLVGRGSHAEQMAEAAESVARVVAYLRVLRDGVPDA